MLSSICLLCINGISHSSTCQQFASTPPGGIHCPHIHSTGASIDIVQVHGQCQCAVKHDSKALCSLCNAFISVTMLQRANSPATVTNSFALKFHILQRHHLLQYTITTSCVLCSSFFGTNMDPGSCWGHNESIHSQLTVLLVQQLLWTSEVPAKVSKLQWIKWLNSEPHYK